MSSPRVTVIMNCYNSAQFLAEAISSVLAQSFQDWEIVFWDNQSTDNSAAIAQGISDARMRYFYAPTHTPLGEARARAIEAARGDWIALLDCDDWWFPDKLARQMALVDKNPALGLVYSDMWLCDATLKEMELGSRRYRMRRGMVWGSLLSARNFIPCPAALLRRSAVLAVGNVNPALRFCEEYDLFLKIAERYPVDYVAEPLVKYRLHSGNTTGLGTSATTIEAMHTIWGNYRTGFDRSLGTAVRVGMRLLVLSGKLLLQNNPLRSSAG